MDAEDLLSKLETVYVLPGDSLAFVTAREFSPQVLWYFMDELEKIFPEQKVNLISGVHKVLIERKPLIAVENAPEPFFDARDKAALDGADNEWQKRQEAEPIHVVDKESSCGCISDFGD